MYKQKKDFINFFKYLFEDIQPENIIDIKKRKSFKSLREYARYFEIPYPSFRYEIIKCFDNIFGVKKSREIRSILWPSSHYVANLKKQTIKNEIINQLERNYPKNIYNISTLTDLALRWKLNRLTLTKRIKGSLIHKYDIRLGNQIFYELWASKKIRNNPINYNTIKKHIRRKNGHVITKEEIFNIMKE
jgi:hypothetical protein